MKARQVQRELDEARVRILEEAYDRAWCAGDLDALMACFTVDAVLVNPRGQLAAGEQAIRKMLGAFLDEANQSGHQSTVDRIAFIGDDVAVVDGHAAIAAASRAVLLEHPFTAILIRTESGDWRIAHVRAYHFEDRT
jgi:uncharacterized protein (TIGR02246 family)